METYYLESTEKACQKAYFHAILKNLKASTKILAMIMHKIKKIYVFTNSDY